MKLFRNEWAADVTPNECHDRLPDETAARLECERAHWPDGPERSHCRRISDVLWCFDRAAVREAG